MFFLLNQLVQNILYPCEWIDLFSHMRESYPISIRVMCILFTCAWIVSYFHVCDYFWDPCSWIISRYIPARESHPIFISQIYARVLYIISMRVNYISCNHARDVSAATRQLRSVVRDRMRWGEGVTRRSVSVHGGNNVTGDFVCGGLIIATQWTLYWAFIGSLWRLK